MEDQDPAFHCEKCHDRKRLLENEETKPWSWIVTWTGKRSLEINGIKGIILPQAGTAFS